ncbi:MAG: hypothetical protein JWN73_3476 [Betaproteobacteria bacterium]|nr:hypothetical protein [Betaproteobacteria bacterium]
MYLSFHNAAGPAMGAVVPKPGRACPAPMGPGSPRNYVL